MLRLLPEDPLALELDEPPERVRRRLESALTPGPDGPRAASPRLAGRWDGDRGILWLDGPFSGNAFRRRLRFRLRPSGRGGTELRGSFAVHPRIRLLFGALVVGALAFFAAGLYVALTERSALPFPFLLMPPVVWGLRTLGLAASRAEERKLATLLEDAVRGDGAPRSDKLPAGVA